MDASARVPFNAAFTDALYDDFMRRFGAKVGQIPFRVAETPLFFTHAYRDRLASHAREIVAQLSRPATIAEGKTAIPARYDAPGMDPLPNCVQVDFAVTRNDDGEWDGRVVELQAFPSLYALMSVQSDTWAEVFQSVPGLEGTWDWSIGTSPERAHERIRELLLGGCDPKEVVLVDYDPDNQKTLPDFIATEQLYGVERCCVTKLKKRGNKLFRDRDGVETQVKRIYNRLVFDELEVKKVAVPFDWRDDLDLTWCSHPNWYWVWSKFSLPHLDHASVPKTRYLDELQDIPADLENYVLKPLFSFAGSGVKVDVTRADLDSVPAGQRHQWVLQRKITYANAITMPEGHGVKAEVRVMLLRPPAAATLEPIIALVRLSRGKMLGVDFNKGLTWVGGSVGMWRR